MLELGSYLGYSAVGCLVGRCHRLSTVVGTFLVCSNSWLLDVAWISWICFATNTVHSLCVQTSLTLAFYRLFSSTVSNYIICENNFAFDLHIDRGLHVEPGQKPARSESRDNWESLGQWHLQTQGYITVYHCNVLLDFQLFSWIFQCSIMSKQFFQFQPLTVAPCCTIWLALRMVLFCTPSKRMKTKPPERRPLCDMRGCPMSRCCMGTWKRCSHLVSDLKMELLSFANEVAIDRFSALLSNWTTKQATYGNQKIPNRKSYEPIMNYWYNITYYDTWIILTTATYLRWQLPRPMDLVFLDHSKALYLTEIRRLEDLGFIRKGTVVVADNIGGCTRDGCSSDLSPNLRQMGTLRQPKA